MLNRIIRTQTVSTEAEDVSGKTQNEREYVFYGQITQEELQGLDQYPTELQEQYAIQKQCGAIRVRRSVSDGNETFTQAIKTWEPGVFGKKEAQHLITSDEFQMFKKIADSGFYKRRFKIPYNESLTWEVDAILKSSGDFTGWIKIDLEIPDGYAGKIPELSDLPLNVTNAIVNQFDSRTADEVETLKGLQENVFDCIKN